MYGYTGQFNAQTLTDWTSEWGGGSLPKAQHGTALITPGMSVRMTPGGPWDTFYQLQRMEPQNDATQSIFHVVYKVSASDLPACQAVEGEIFKNDGQFVIDGGFQYDIKGTKRFRTYDYAASKWVATTIPCDDSLLSDGKPLDSVVVYDLTPQTITYRGVQINGTWIPLGITRPAVHKPGHACFNYATQFDFTKLTNVATMLNPCVDITVT